MTMTEVLAGTRQWHVECDAVLPALRRLPDGCVHCCVTSPPYWRLRKYLPKGHARASEELGTEDAPDCFGWATGSRCGACFVCRLTEVFREVRRVLHPSGTLWVNVAGSYNAAGRVGHGTRIGHKQQTNRASATKADDCRPSAQGWKQKDFINTPALLAESLRVDGWYYRSEITLCKVSPMPNSVRDRPTSATEKLYFFSKNPKYYYDQDAERVPHASADDPRNCPGYEPKRERNRGGRDDGYTSSSGAMTWPEGGRNLWDYWTDEPDYCDDTPEGVWEWRPDGGTSVEGHYASYPQFIPRRCYRLGASIHGVCPACNSPWRRVTGEVAVTPDLTQRSTSHYNTADRYGAGNGGNSGLDRLAARMRAGIGTGTVGWEPTCGCERADVLPPLVMDVFSGSGTSGVVARMLGMRYLGIELFEEYAEASRARIARPPFYRPGKTRKPRKFPGLFDEA